MYLFINRCNGFVIYGQKIEAEHAGRMAHRSLIYGGPIIARGPSEQKSRGYSGVYTGKTGYTPRINGDKRPYTDCIHYLNSVCNNESHVGFVLAVTMHCLHNSLPNCHNN